MHATLGLAAGVRQLRRLSTHLAGHASLMYSFLSSSLVGVLRFTGMQPLVLGAGIRVAL